MNDKQRRKHNAWQPICSLCNGGLIASFLGAVTSTNAGRSDFYKFAEMSPSKREIPFRFSDAISARMSRDLLLLLLLPFQPITEQSHAPIRARSKERMRRENRIKNKRKEENRD